MRRRLGAIHSDSIEDFVETAIKAENHEGVYYSGIIKKTTEKPTYYSVGSFDYDIESVSTR